MLVLGVETSCDETAAAVVEDGWRVLSNSVWSQVAGHAPYGGVVPELASRAHVETIARVVDDALSAAGVGWPAIDRLAVTRGPGLASSLLIGMTAVKALALRTAKPYFTVNHLQAHVYACFLGNDGQAGPREDEKVLALLVSGGHTCLAWMEGVNTYRLVGRTLDDAAGEALDKGACLLGLGYPGGPAIEKAAAGGDAKRWPFPVGHLRSHVPTGGLDPGLCFSFSGVKTALRVMLERNPPCQGDRADLAAGYQHAVFSALLERVALAADRLHPDGIVCGGGVLRNASFRKALQETAAVRGIQLYLAEPAYCADNAAMVAALAGCPRYVQQPGGWDGDIQPRLSLETA